MHNNQYSDLIKIIGMIIFACVFMYLAMKALKAPLKVMEGLTNPTPTSATALDDNKASGAQAYADEIKKIYSKLSDNLLIKDNRTAYENVVIQMDDLINAVMVQKMMSISKDSLSEDTLISTLSSLNILSQGKVSLNSVMKYIDSV